jgi:hypothetical protein
MPFIDAMSGLYWPEAASRQVRAIISATNPMRTFVCSESLLEIQSGRAKFRKYEIADPQCTNQVFDQYSGFVVVRLLFKLVCSVLFITIRAT